MTSKISSQSIGRKNAGTLWQKVNWLGAVALLGVALLLAAVSFSTAKIPDKTLPNILRQLQEQGKKVKGSTVMDLGGESVITVTLANGEVRTYDGQGRLKKTKEPNGDTTEYENGMPTVEKNAGGAVLSMTTYFRSADGKLRKSVKIDKTGTQTKLFDANGDILQATSPQGTKSYSRYEKNDKGKPTSYCETDMNTGKTEQIILNPEDGSVVAKIDQNGVRTTISTIKDSNGETLSTIEEDSRGNKSEKRYQNGQIVETIENGVHTLHENILDGRGVMIGSRERRLLNTSAGSTEEVTTKKFDDAGRVLERIDKEGRHTFTYELDDEGRITVRTENIQRADGTGKTKRKITRYDDAGRVVSLTEDGRTTNTSYVTDDKGNILASTETTTITVGIQNVVQTVVNEFNDNGQIMAKTDNNGLRTEFTYDARGNRLSSQSRYEESHYEYDDNGTLLFTTTQDHRSLTLTWNDTKTQLASQKLKILNNGVVQVTFFGLDAEGFRVSCTTEAFGIRSTVYRDGQSDQPLRTVFVKNNGKKTITDYDYVGDVMVHSRDKSPDSSSETEYNISGKPQTVKNTDRWGRVSTMTYTYAYGRTVGSETQDTKGRTVIQYDEFEEATTTTRYNTIGFPRVSSEQKIYSEGILVRSISTDVKGKSETIFDENEQPKVVERTNDHGFPRKNWVDNVYNSSGEISNSYQIDSRGFTSNQYGDDGLMSVSVRYSIYGYPKVNTTNYQYENGEMKTSLVEDDRSHTTNEFDQDGLMRKSVQTRDFGFPRVTTNAFQYNGDGYMVYSDSTDENGYTNNWYNVDEQVAISYRENSHGHARQQWTINEYDGDGFMLLSKETDLRGAAFTIFNMDNLATANMRFDDYGVVFSQDTLTFNNYDDKGFMTTASSKNLLTNIDKTVDKDGLTRSQTQDDNYGVINSRHKDSKDYQYDEHGRMLTNTTSDALGDTYSQYDINGDATWSQRVNFLGPKLGRVSTTDSQYEPDTGMTLWSHSYSDLNDTLTINAQDHYGLAQTIYTTSYKGAELGRKTETDVLQNNIYTGFTEETYAFNGLNEVWTWNKQDDCGLPWLSLTHNFKGAEWGRWSITAIDTDRFDGMTNSTDAWNYLSYTTTHYSKDEFRLPDNSHTTTWLGATIGHETDTTIHSNPEDGMTDQTIATNHVNRGSWDETSVTVTNYNQNEWRLPESSMTDKNFGAIIGQHTDTTISSNVEDGMTDKTIATNVYQSPNGLLMQTTTTTEYDSNEWRLPTWSSTQSNFGAVGGRYTETTIFSNHYDGMTDKTVAGNGLNTTTTYYTTTNDRLPGSSDTTSYFGATISQQTHTEIHSNADDGMTDYTVATNALADGKTIKTTTIYSQDQWRLPTSSISEKNFGAMIGRTTLTPIINTDHGDGMTNSSAALNWVGSHFGILMLTATFTDYSQDEWRLPNHSWTINNFGAILGRVTDTIIHSNHYDGMTDDTIASNGLSTTTTTYHQTSDRLPGSSETTSYRGPLISQSTHTDIFPNYDDGMTDQTIATNCLPDGKYTQTTTIYSQDEWRLPHDSITEKNFGANISRTTTTGIASDTDDGLTDSTTATNTITTASGVFMQTVTTTHYSTDEWRLPDGSETTTNFGAKISQDTLTEIHTNHYDGMTDDTIAKNTLQTSFGVYELISTTTFYSQDMLRLPTRSETVRTFGALIGQVTETGIVSNPNDGMTDQTVAVNSIGSRGYTFTTTTTTDYSQDEWRLPNHSQTQNNFGAVLGQITDTTISSNQDDGLTDWTSASNGLSRVLTAYSQDASRLPCVSATWGFLGAELGRFTLTGITSNLEDGMTDETFALNSLSHVRTVYSHDQWRLPEASETWSFRGAVGGRYTQTGITSNHVDGITDKTIAQNDLSTTTTWYSQDQWRMPFLSKSENRLGAEFGKTTWTVLFSDHMDGMTDQSVAMNGLNLVITNYSHDEFRLPSESHTYSWRGAVLGWYTYTQIITNHKDGMTDQTIARNGLSEVQTNYSQDEWRMPESSDTHNYFGAELGRDTHTLIFSNHYDGMSDQTIADNGLSTTTTWNAHDAWRLPWLSYTQNKRGANLGRNTLTVINSNPNDGMSNWTFATNQLNWTLTNYSQDMWRLPVSSDSWSWRGAMLGWYTHTQIYSDAMDGMTDQTVAENGLSKTTTTYNKDEWRLPGYSRTENKFGAEWAKVTESYIYNSPQDGMTDETWAFTGLSATHTVNSQDEWRLGVYSDTWNYYGAELGRYTQTDIWSNQDDGLTDTTLAKNDLTWTVTHYSEDNWRMPVASESWSFRGALMGRYSWSDIMTDKQDGMTDWTVAHTDLSTTTTWNAFDDRRLPCLSYTQNNYGATANRDTWTLITSDPSDGMTASSLAIGALSWTLTNYGMDDWRQPVESWTLGFRGANLGRLTYTTISTNHADGMTDETWAHNYLNTVKTIYSQDEFRLPAASETWGSRGSLLGRYTYTQIVSDPYDGMTDMTIATNGLSTVTTWNNQDEYRLAGLSLTENRYGADLGKTTWTVIQSNPTDGMTDVTLAMNDLSWTQTDYSQDEYRMPVDSQTWTFRGALLARYTYTVMTTNPDDGMTDKTEAYNGMGKVTTWFTNDEFRTAWLTKNESNYGAELGMVTWTVLNNSRLDGMADSSWAYNGLSTVLTINSQDMYRLPVQSRSWSYRGAYLARYTTTKIASNPSDGMTDETWAHSVMNDTHTVYSQDEYRMPESSHTTSYRGASAGRETDTTIYSNPNDGMADLTVATNGLNTVYTYNTQDQYRLPGLSVTVGSKGPVLGQFTVTVINSDQQDGMTNWTYALNGLNWTFTEFSQDEWRAPVQSNSYSFRGATAGRFTTTALTTNKLDGLTDMAVAENGLATTTTWNSQDEWRLPYLSKTENKKGAVNGRTTWTTINTDPESGMTNETWAFNGLTNVHTVYTQDDYHLADESETWNNLGPELACYTYTDIHSNPDDGMQDYSVAENGLNKITTWNSNDEWRLPYKSETLSNRGALDGRDTTTELHTSQEDGMTDWTKADNGLATVWTYNDSSDTRLPYQSLTYNKYGAEYGKWVVTDITSNANDGMTDKTVAVSGLATVTTYNSTTDGYRAPYKTETVNNYGAGSAGLIDENGAVDMTTTYTYTSPLDGLMLWTDAFNDLSEVKTFYTNDQYRLPYLSYSHSYRGATFAQDSVTITKSDYHTGLTSETYTESMLNKSWTYYDGNGLQTSGWSQACDPITLGYGVLTYNEYTMRGDTSGTMSKSTATNQLGYTENTYDENGLMTYSENHAAYGVVSLTTTGYLPNYWTGGVSQSVAYSYSRKDESKLISKASSYFDDNGQVYEVDSLKSTGPINGRTSVTTNFQYDPDTGTKQYSETTTDLSFTASYANVKGLDTYSVTTNNLGTNNSRETTQWDFYDDNTGVKTKSYAKNKMNETWSYFDVNGLPVGGGNVYQERHNEYSASVAGSVEQVYAGEINFDGTPLMTRTVTPISVTDNYMKADGSMDYSWTGNEYGMAGDELSKSTYKQDAYTGMNIEIDKQNYHMKDGNWTPWGHSISYNFDPTYGYALNTKSWSADKNGTEGVEQDTDLQYDPDTGMTTYSHTKSTDGNSESWGYTYDDRGRKTSGETHQNKDSGDKDHHTVSQQYGSDYEYNEYTGIIQHETKHAYANCDWSGDKEVWYDDNGLEQSSWSSNQQSAAGEAYEFTKYYRDAVYVVSTDPSEDADNELPSVAVTEYSGASFGVVMTKIKQELQSADELGGMHATIPRVEILQYHYGEFITQQTIAYNFNGDSEPIGADVTDDKGAEHWVMTGYASQGNATLISRDRTNNDGSSFSWRYTDIPCTGLYHTSADITYINYLGMYTGSGTETYTDTGILQQQVLNNTDMWNEVITYQNDGQYVTTSSGVREDGITVNYSHTGTGEIAQSSDDKGITTWDPSTEHMVSTQGSLGTFTYTYSGAGLVSIQGSVANGGTVVMDKNWNVQTWTDSNNIVHTYIPLTKVKGYVTSATESFTDANGIVWSGTVKYKDTGFYFAGETLHATHVNLSQAIPGSKVILPKTTAADYIKQQMASHNTQADTFTWQPDGAQGPRTLGDYMQDGFTADQLTGFADVEVTINADGSSTSKFSNVQFTAKQFVQKTRYKPVCSTRTYTVQQDTQPADSDNRNMGNYNNVFYNGPLGTRTQVTSSQKVTRTENQTYYVSVIPDDPTTSQNEYKEIEMPSQVYDNYGSPLYRERTRQVQVTTTEWTITVEDWTKAEDGWQWVATGVAPAAVYADAAPLSADTGAIANASPVGTQGDQTAAAVDMHNYDSSVGSHGSGQSLGGAFTFTPGAYAIPTPQISALTTTQDPGVPDAPTVSVTYNSQAWTTNTNSSATNGSTSYSGISGSSGGFFGSITDIIDSIVSAVVSAVNTALGTTATTAAANKVAADNAALDNIEKLSAIALNNMSLFLQLIAQKIDDVNTLTNLQNSTANNLADNVAAAFGALFGDNGPNSLANMFIGGNVTGTSVVTQLMSILTGGVTANGANDAGTLITTANANRADKSIIQPSDPIAQTFSQINTMDDVYFFLSLVVSRTNNQAIVTALQTSTAASLMGALTSAYDSIFGNTYQQSLLNKLVTLSTNSTAIVEDLRAAIFGGTVSSGEVKLAAKIAHDMENAKSVQKNSDGDVIEVVDSGNNTHQYQYQNGGFVETVTDPSGQVVTNSYNSSGLLLSQTTGSQTNMFQYVLVAGIVQQVVQVQRSEGGVTTTQYDSQGRLTLQDVEGQREVYVYSGPGTDNYTVQLFGPSGALQEQRTVQGGKLAQRTSANGSTSSYSYITDGTGQVLAVTAQVTDKDGKQTYLKYDATGRLVTVQGQDMTQAQNVAGDQTNITNQAFQFDATKELFGDHRMDSMRLNQTFIQGTYGQQQ